MMIDDKLIEYIKTIAYDKKDGEHFEEKKGALLRYDFDTGYGGRCSYQLKDFVDLEKLRD